MVMRASSMRRSPLYVLLVSHLFCLPSKTSEADMQAHHYKALAAVRLMPSKVECGYV